MARKRKRGRRSWRNDSPEYRGFRELSPEATQSRHCAKHPAILAPYGHQRSLRTRDHDHIGEGLGALSGRHGSSPLVPRGGRGIFRVGSRRGSEPRGGAHGPRPARPRPGRRGNGARGGGAGARKRGGSDPTRAAARRGVERAHRRGDGARARPRRRARPRVPARRGGGEPGGQCHRPRGRERSRGVSRRLHGTARPRLRRRLVVPVRPRLRVPRGRPVRGVTPALGAFVGAVSG